MGGKRISSRGNPWHDERGRFCSGPRNGGVISSSEVEKVDLNDGDSVRLKTTEGNFLFETNTKKEWKGKRKHEQTLSVKDGKVVVETDTTLNGKVTHRVDTFDMSYKDFKEFISLTRTKYDKDGDVCQEFDNDRICFYDNSDSYFGNWCYYNSYDGTPQKCNTFLSFDTDGEEFEYSVKDRDENEIAGGIISKSDDGFVVTPEHGDPWTIREGYEEYNDVKDCFRILELQSHWK